MEELDFRLHVIFLKRWRIYIFCGGGKEGKYLEKEKIFGEEKNICWRRKTEEKEENIWRRKDISWEEKKNGEGKGGKYLETERTFLRRRRKAEKEKEANIMEKQNSRDGWTRTG